MPHTWRVCATAEEPHTSETRVSCDEQEADLPRLRPAGGTRSLSSEAVHWATPLDTVRSRSCPCLCGQDVQKLARGSWRTLSHSSLLLGTLLVCLQFPIFHKALNEHFSVCFLARVSLRRLHRKRRSGLCVCTSSTALDDASFSPKVLVAFCLPTSRV